ncbi:MAG TPA: hypothetical protein VHT26_00375, partial [Trebonia sp.]|nr:hypothetical protein [Trebonia sp.]
ASGAKYATSWTGSNIVHIARAALFVSATTAPSATATSVGQRLPRGQCPASVNRYRAWRPR